MSPYEFAKRECANYTADGGCLGITPEGLFDPGLPATPRDKCLLAGKLIQPCRYFEKVVLPLADQQSPKTNPRLQAQRLEARQKYFEGCCKPVKVSGVVRECPDCGGLLAYRQRICSKCVRQRRKATYRKARQKQAV